MDFKPKLCILSKSKKKFKFSFIFSKLFNCNLLFFLLKELFKSFNTNKNNTKTDNYDYVPYEKVCKKSNISKENNSIEELSSSYYEDSFKISSTLIQTSFTNEESKNAYSNKDYMSSDSSSSSLNLSMKICSCCTNINLDDNDCSIYKQDQIFVCFKSYEAKIQGDLGLKYADRVKLICLNDGIALIENVISGKLGYVPFHNHLCTLDQFLNELTKKNRF